MYDEPESRRTFKGYEDEEVTSTAELPGTETLIPVSVMTKAVAIPLLSVLIGKVVNEPSYFSLSTPPNRILPPDAFISSKYREYVRDWMYPCVMSWSTRFG
jgi:hypothetical protein